MTLYLTLACGLYNRTLSLRDGSVAPEGIELNYVPMGPAELFRRQGRHAEFDVSEFSLATYTILYAQGDRRMVAIPVFPSRKFRHSEIFINTRAGIREPRDLAGRAMGTMEYQQTAAVWMRAHLEHDYGVRPDQIEWYFGGFNEPEEYTERVPVALPANVRSKTISSQQSLDAMLDAGEIAGLMGAATPASFRRGSPNVARLFPNYQEVEDDYFRHTGIFPIMHLVVVKREIYERAPWVATSIYRAFDQAKAAALHRLTGQGALFVEMPWLQRQIEESAAVMGPDPFAYGLEANRKLLETFLGHMLEQGLIDRPLTVNELFAPETHGRVA